MTTAIPIQTKNKLDELLILLRADSVRNLRASRYYATVYYFYFVPSSFLLATVSVLSFLASSQTFSERTNVILSLLSGGLSIVSGFLYTLLNGFEIQSKWKAFREAHQDYIELLTDLQFQRMGIVEGDIELVFHKARTKVLKIKKRLRYSPPQRYLC